MRSLFVLVSAGFVLMTGVSSAAVEIPNAFHRNGQVQGKTLVEVDPVAQIALAAGDRNIKLTDVPLVSGAKGQFDLERFDVFTPDAQILEFNGVASTPVSRPDVILYRGKDTSDPARSVFLSITNGTEVRMMVTGKEEASFLNPEKDASGQVTHKLSKADPNALVGFICGNERLPKSSAQLASLTRSIETQALTAQTLQADLLIDLDYRLFSQAFGSDSNAASTYVANLIGAVSSIYHRDINVLLSIRHLIVWTAPDPFDAGSSDAQLTNYENYNKTNGTRQGMQRDTAHLLAFRPYGGIAYMGSLCNTDFSYGLSNIDADAIFPVGGYHWDLFVVAHEIGHNFNSAHTHCYTPPIDCCYTSECNCGAATPVTGTIMSYCHLLSGGVNLVFHDRSKTIMRTYAEASFCITAGTATPEINITGNGISIPDGKWWTDGTDGTFMGDVYHVSGSLSRTYTIHNTGQGTLTLGAPSVTISGANASEFFVSAPPAASVAAGGSTTFQITFDPNGVGARSATVNVASDDSDEANYDFIVAGQGTSEPVATADLSTVQSSSGNAYVNQPFWHIITATNNGSGTAAGVVLTATLPVGTVLTAATCDWGAVSSGSGYAWITLGNMSPGQSATMSLTLTAPAPGAYNNTANVSATTTDPNPVNNSSVSGVNVTQPDGPDLIGSWGGVTPTCRQTRRGENCSFRGSINLNNVGNQNAPKRSRVLLYLSADGFFDGSDRLIATVQIKPAINAGSGLSKSFSARAGGPVAGQYLIAVVDGANIVSEYDEANNVIVTGPF